MALNDQQSSPDFFSDVTMPLRLYSNRGGSRKKLRVVLLWVWLPHP